MHLMHWSNCQLASPKLRPVFVFFQLPLLQPSLTGTNGIEGKGQSAFLAPFSTRWVPEHAAATYPPHAQPSISHTLPGSKRPGACFTCLEFVCACRAGSARQQNADDASTSGSGAMGGMEIKGWERQARDITTDISSSDKYKSLALHAEVKLAESLERCERVCASTFTPTGEAKPNKLKTAVCCQVSCSILAQLLAA